MSPENTFGRGSISKSDVLAVIAHPDDEIYVSGTLCLLAEKDLRIALICVTDGENGGATELFPHVKSNLRLGVIRLRELALSAWVLGVRDIVCLSQEDIRPEQWGKGRAWDQGSLIETLRKIIQQTDPKLILTHGPRGGYGHPAHQEVSRCVMAVARDISFAGSVFSFAGQVKYGYFSWHFDQPSTVLVDVRGFLRRRIASLCYHQTQSEFFLRPYVPRTFRKVLSVMFGLAFAFTEPGRRRVPIVTPKRFFQRFPTEGLVLQMACSNGRPHFFQEYFGNDPRVRFDS
jgi:LmbE family N-acetylglucosaminyl deacetylase